MYRIAILGCENSHANNFLELIRLGAYPEIEVVGVYSVEIEAALKLHETYGVRVLGDFVLPEGAVDGVMITARHGDDHYRFARPYMDRGIPMFIDKPITCSEEEALAFMREAREKGVRFCGGSTCAAVEETRRLSESVRTEAFGTVLGGTLICPLQSASVYGGFFFYAQHLVEVMTAVFGESVREIRADRRAESLTFTARYDSYDVTGTYIERIGYYQVSVCGKKAIHTEKLTINQDSFRHEMDDMLDLLHGGEMKKSYESFITPVFIMNTILRAEQSGAWERMPEIVI